MIHVPRPSATKALSSGVRTEMAARKRATAGLKEGDADIERAWKKFRKTRAGANLTRALRTLFRSKCAYCERSVTAGTVDHIYPKRRYPKRMFLWGNLLLCCADCNLFKGDFFRLIDGRPCFLNPTRDQPREYFVWDLRTGAIAPVAGPDRHERAKITCDRLRLDADRLRIDRLERIENIISFLDDVLEEDPVSESTKNNLRRSLSVELSYLGAIDYLFHVSNPYSAWVDAAREKLPEIDDWLRPWA